MAVANSFIFGGVNSKEYSAAIDGPGNYTAPKRVVESVSIPGRNGAYLLDQGYYENCEAKFKVVVRAKTQS